MKKTSKVPDGLLFSHLYNPLLFFCLFCFSLIETAQSSPYMNQNHVTWNQLSLDLVHQYGARPPECRWEADEGDCLLELSFSFWPYLSCKWSFVPILSSFLICTYNRRWFRHLLFIALLDVQKGGGIYMGCRGYI